MKDLKKYAFANATIKVDEAKGTSWEDAPGNVTPDKVVGDNGKPAPDTNKIKKGKGEETESNNGGWKVRFPDQAKVAKEKLGVKNMSNNKRALFASFQAREDFFCQGKAGWAKSSLIYAMCDVFNLVCITVNLDKVEAVELGGIPTPIKDNKGRVRQQIATPAWTNFMLDNPQYNYLLFFDEMNQAPGDVQNALMPIVNDHIICGIEFENMFVGAAGNLAEENDYLTELSRPLKARFNIIDWESDTPGEWKSSFEYLHSKWDKILGKELVTRFEEVAADSFESPRDVEKKIFKFLKNTIDAPTFDKDDTFDSSDILKRFGRFVKGGSLQGLKEQSRTAYDNIVRLSEFIAQWLQAGGLEGWEEKKNQGATTRSARGKQTSFGLEPADIDLLERAIKTGVFTNSEEADEKHPRGKKYGVTRENFRNLMDEDVLNAEQFTRFLKMMEDKGVKFKYEKDSDLPANLPPIPKE